MNDEHSAALVKAAYEFLDTVKDAIRDVKVFYARDPNLRERAADTEKEPFVQEVKKACIKAVCVLSCVFVFCLICFTLWKNTESYEVFIHGGGHEFDSKTTTTTHGHGP